MLSGKKYVYYIFGYFLGVTLNLKGSGSAICSLDVEWLYLKWEITREILKCFYKTAAWLLTIFFFFFCKYTYDLKLNEVYLKIVLHFSWWHTLPTFLQFLHYEPSLEKLIESFHVNRPLEPSQICWKFFLHICPPEIWLHKNFSLS